MKSFMKLVVTLLVFAIIGYIAYCLVTNNVNNSNDIKNEDSDVSEKINNNEENLLEEISGDEIELPGNSGEISGEFIESNSGEEIVEEVTDSKEKIMSRIDVEVEKIKNGEVLNNISTNLTSDLVSDSAREFMAYFKVEELSVNINVMKDCVEIIPTSDFIDNMAYYFDEEGNLILYESISNTIGGSTRYYFEKGKSIDVIWNYDEDIEQKEEYVFAVLGRAQAIYDKYLK